MSKEKIITAITFIVLIAAFATGIYFIVRLVNGPESAEKSSDIMSGELKTYTHPDYGFTFNYPANFKLGTFPEGDGEVILVQNEDGKQGFQIFVSPYAETEDLSFDIIKKSAPDMKIANEQEVTLNQLGSEASKSSGEQDSALRALSFDTESTHEVWFVQDGNLYQITSFKEFGGRMEEIIKSLRFN